MVRKKKEKKPALCQNCNKKGSEERLLDILATPEDARVQYIYKVTIRRTF